MASAAVHLKGIATAVAVLAATLSLFVSLARAQDARDARANEKIDEAISKHYLESRFDKAEALLLEAIQACADECQPATIARAWMYTGIVRGSGKGDQGGALVAFREAFDADPAVVVDEGLATAETHASFEQVRDERGPPPAPAGTAPQAPIAAGAPAAGGLPPLPSAPEPTVPGPVASVGIRCTGSVTRVDTRRPVPVSCTSDQPVGSMLLRYLAFGDREWSTLVMPRVGASFQAEIPCAVTEIAGPLEYFVVAVDADGLAVDMLGSRSKPMRLDLVTTPVGPPPAFPGQPPPARCPQSELCPPDFPGCGGDPKIAQRRSKDRGASCTHSAECTGGLLCTRGICDQAPGCRADAECDSGFCNQGRCDVHFAEPARRPDHPRHLVGLHFAADVGFMSGENVCTPDDKHECYYAGTDRRYPPPLPVGIRAELGEPAGPYPGTGIDPGLALGTLRVLASYDYAVSPCLTLGGRLGLAFRGGPSPRGETGFLPAHLEARATYFPPGLGVPPLRPYVEFGGGVARVDLKTEVVVKDCSGEPDRFAFDNCIQAAGSYDSADQPNLPEEELDAYRRFGPVFLSAGAGAMVTLENGLGVQAELAALYLFPDSGGLVVQPSVGGVYTF